MDRILNLLGLCARAGRLVSGEANVVQLIRSGKARLAILDLGAARNTSKSVRDACHSHAAKLIFVPEGRLGAAIGKPGRMAAATADEGFAKRLDELYGVQNTIGGA